MDDWEQLRQRFNRTYAEWGIELPVDAMSPGKVWLIVQRGWTIWTRFDIGAKDGREHLDCYSRLDDWGLLIRRRSDARGVS